MLSADQSPPDTALARAYHFKPVKMILWQLAFAALAAGSVFMAYRSLDPAFYEMQHSSRYQWVNDMLNGLPVWARVGVWLALGALCALGGLIFLRRWLTGLPPLELSAQGVTGFTKGFGPTRLTIPWNEISKFQRVQSNFMIFGAPASAGGPKPKPIVVHLGMVGQKFDMLVTEIEAFRQRVAR